MVIQFRRQDLVQIHQAFDNKVTQVRARKSRRQNQTRICHKRRRKLSVERLTKRDLLAADFVNPGNELDVNNDLSITPLDALLVINHLSAESRQQPGDPALQSEHFVNTSGDENVTPFDALMVINRLAREEPEVAFRLVLDTDHDENGTPSDQVTFHLGLEGRVNFGGATPPLFLDVGTPDSEQWLDLSGAISANGSFSITDAELRQHFGNNLVPGARPIRFASDDQGSNLRDLDVQLLSAPPLPSLVVASLSEDGEVRLDIQGEVYDPDSAPDAVVLAIEEQPSNGELIPQDDAFIYRPDPNFFGEDYIVYTVSDEQQSLGLTTLTLTVESVNDLPEIPEIDDVMLDGEGFVEIPFDLPEMDADGETAEYYGYVTANNPLAEIRDTYDLNFAGDDYYNLTGLGEKWLFGGGGDPIEGAQGEEPAPRRAFFLTPEGDLIEWLGSYESTADRGALIARLGVAVYEDPSLLYAAAPEILADATVTFENGRILVVPDPGLEGELNVKVVAGDELDAISRSFKVTVDPMIDEQQAEHGMVVDLMTRAASLDQNSSLDYINQLASEVGDFDGVSAAQIVDLMRQLKLANELTEIQLRTSEQWAETQKRLRQREVDKLQYVADELEILKSEYETAWNDFQSNLDESIMNPATLPPVFVNGNTTRTYKVYRGDLLEIDFRAVHPEQLLPFYSFSDDFEYDAEEHGQLSVHPQTGLFSWQTPESASGNYTFTVEASTGGNGPSSTSSAMFTVEILDNDPRVESLTILAPAVSDTGTDEITLVANNVTHPDGEVDSVSFYQDMDGDGAFNRFIDQFLGDDSSGDDGYSTTILPRPIDNASEVTFFAQASYYTPSARNVSQPASVTVPVVQTAGIDIDFVQPMGGEMDLGPRETTFSTKNFATYGDQLGVRVTSESDGIHLQRYTDMDEFGNGTPIGDSIRVIDDRPDNIIVRADADGNVAILHRYAEAFSSVIDSRKTVWMLRLNADNQPIGDVIEIANQPGDGGDFEIGFDMNSRGEGIIAWRPYYGGDMVYLQSFTGGGETLGEMQALPFPGGGGFGPDWHSVSINEMGDYVVAWQNYAATGSASSEEPASVVFNDYFGYDSAINSIGWTVLANFNNLQVLDAQGQKVGPSITTEGSNRNILDVRFVGDEHFDVLWNDRSSDRMVSQRFELNLQPGLQPTELDLLDISMLSSDSPVAVSFTVENLATEDSEPMDAVFYLSYDDQLSANDRVLETISITDVIPSESIRTFSATFNLPVDQDPIWAEGTTGLNLIMSIPASGAQIVAAVPYVHTNLSQETSVTGETTPEVTRPMAPAASTPRYIRPGVVAQQIGSSDFEKSIDMMAVLGWQFVSAATQLSQQANDQLANEIDPLIREVQSLLNTYYSSRFSLQEARDMVQADALAAKQAAEAAADADYDRELALAAKTGNRELAKHRKAIRDEQATKEQRVQRETARLEKELAETRAAYQSRIQQIEQQNAAQQKANTVSTIGNLFGAFGEFPGLGGAVGAIFGGASGGLLSGSVDCLADPIECAQQIGGKLSGHHQKMLDEANRVFAPVIEDLESKLEIIDETIQDLIDIVVKPIQQAIDDTFTWYDDKKESLVKTRDEKKDAAEKTYNREKEKVDNFNDNIVNEAKSAIEPLSKVPASLDEVVKVAKDPGGALEQAVDSLGNVDLENPFGTVESILEKSKFATDIADGVLEQLGEELAPLVDVAKQAGGDFAEWSKETGGTFADWTQETGGDIATWVQENITDVLNEEIIAYKVTTDFDFDLNLTNGSIYVDAKIGPGLSYDSRKLRDLLNGSFSFPDIDPIEAATKLFGFDLIVTDNYNEVRDGLYAQHGPQNVYFSSERFVDYVGVESVVSVAAEAFLLGAAAAEDALKELGEQLRLEMNDVMGWLELKGEEQIEAIVPGLMKSFLTQEDFVSPHLEVRWTQVDYHYELVEGPVLGKAIKAIAGDDADLSDLIGGKELNVTSPHGAFAIVWSIPEGIDPLDPTEIDAEFDAHLDKLNFSEPSGPSLTSDLVDLALQELESEGVPSIVIDTLSLLTTSIGSAQQFEDELKQLIFDELGLDVDLIESKLSSGNPIVDLKGTSVGERLSLLLGKMTFGNAGASELKSMKLNLNKMTLEIEGSLCHKHSWGSVSDIVGGLVNAF